jgi:hypothetical protein
MAIRASRIFRFSGRRIFRDNEPLPFDRSAAREKLARLLVGDPG